MIACVGDAMFWWSVVSVEREGWHRVVEISVGLHAELCFCQVHAQGVRPTRW